MTNMWTRCNRCRRILYKQDILDNLYVCPECSFHFRISAENRLAILFDDGKYELFDEAILPEDPLHFKDSKTYANRLKENQNKTSLSDAVLNAIGTMYGICGR